ncbi:unnamed protein product [Cuscuta campestris]|uniref:RING-type E3 ubiquitin transferase n=1 Tax=Cuscuta campestris TaxID=132261 RepID=A0A484LX30_9ASTE|nr:unnamed protein product [Cuscuta campestris]
MGAMCCCLRDGYDDHAIPNSSIYRNCMCMRFLLQHFFYVYTSVFHREQRVITSSTQVTASLSSAGSLDNSLSDMYRSPPRPLPYDADPRYFRLQRDGLVSRREKGSSHSHEETEPFRRSDIDDDEDDEDSMSAGNKWDASCEQGLKEFNSKTTLKLSTAKTTGFSPLYSSSSSEEDEDACPTCLEEYTEENPKIILKCSHHFHLGCIYEWMERSDHCPVCGKEMAFDETTDPA